MIQLTDTSFFRVNCPCKSAQSYRTPAHSSLTVSQLLMDIKHGAEEIHKHNWVSGHLQGRRLGPYICLTTHKCHKITCHYWTDHMDSIYCCLMACFGKKECGLRIMQSRMLGCLVHPSREKKILPYSVTFQTSISACGRLVKAGGH